MIEERSSDIAYRSVVEAASTRELHELLRQANAVVLPRLGHLGYESPVFAPHTAEFVHHLQAAGDERVRMEIASTDEEYRELGLHADIWYLPVVLLADPTLGPVIVNLISSFIYDQLKKLLPGKKAEVQAELLIDRGAGTLSLRYKGPAETYEAVMKEALRRHGIGND